jgi:hypothetical protein
MSLSNLKKDQMYVVINKTSLNTSSVVCVCYSKTVAEQQKRLGINREIVGPITVMDTDTSTPIELYTKLTPKIIKIDPGYDFINPDIFTVVTSDSNKQSLNDNTPTTVVHKYE